MKQSVHVNTLAAACTLAWGIAVFLFWWLWFPQALNYHEQNQLFLLTSDYFLQRLSLPGGLADWLSEGLVQFDVLKWAGALLLALLYVLLQRCCWLLIHRAGLDVAITLPVSLLPALLLLWTMGDENVLLSYVVALVGVLACLLLTRRLRWGWHLAVAPVLWWLLGPMAWLYAGGRMVVDRWRGGLSALTLLAAQLLAYATVIDQYPLPEVLLGINYHRIPLMLYQPWRLLAVPVVVLLVLTGCQRLSLTLDKHRRPWVAVGGAAIVVVLTAAAVYWGYDKAKYELLMQDYLVREGRWQQVIERAEGYQVRTALSSNAVNLALAMTRQLADRQFDFYQSGEDALIVPATRDLISTLPAAEAFFQLGMVNAAKRYMYDAQESILNDRQSGRCMKRIAECLIINGQYRTARKYLDVLRQSLFYRKWADEATACLYRDTMVEHHPLWGKLRRYRYQNDFLYSYPELDKMLGLLFVNNPDNKMALDYFMGQMLLKGDAPAFAQHLGWAQQYGGYAQMPRVYQDVMRCLQQGGPMGGSPYAAYLSSHRPVMMEQPTETAK